MVIDASPFVKKGDKSAGVARPWNGRLGPVENSPVGGFATRTRDGVAASVAGELVVPENGFADRARGQEAGIPEALEFRTKGERARDMIRRLRQEGLHFSSVVFDGGYGHLPWRRRAWADESEVFLAEVHSDQTIYRAHPSPAVPAKRSRTGQAPSRLAREAELTVAAWAAGQPASAWVRRSVREGEKGFVRADDLTRRVGLWEGADPPQKPPRWCGANGMGRP